MPYRGRSSVGRHCSFAVATAGTVIALAATLPAGSVAVGQVAAPAAAVVSGSDSVSIAVGGDNLVTNPQLAALDGRRPACYRTLEHGKVRGKGKVRDGEGSTHRYWTVVRKVGKHGYRGLAVARDCAPQVVPGANYRASVRYTSTVGKVRLLLATLQDGTWSGWHAVAKAGRSAATTTLGYATGLLPQGTTRVVFALVARDVGRLTVGEHTLRRVDGPPATQPPQDPGPPAPEPPTPPDPESDDYTLAKADGLPVRWNPCAPIHYRVNPGALGDSVVADTRTALDAITAVNGLQFVYDGTTSDVPQSGDGPNGQAAPLVVAATARSTSDIWGSEDSSAIGVAMWHATGATGAYRITNVGVVIDPASGPAKHAGSGSLSRVTLLLHELGHAVGLGHATGWEIMYPTMGPSSPTSYQAGDRAGLHHLGTAQSCLS